MPKSFFDAYGELARTDASATEISGRYKIQAGAERRIVDDVKRKLSLEPEDSLLDIGCGLGNLLIPLSYFVAEAVGVDHLDIIAKARNIFSGSRVKWMEGEFPKVSITGSFDCVLAYSVIHYLQNLDDVIGFIETGAGLLKEGGRFLVADIPNKDKKKRFGDSRVGREFESEWKKMENKQDSVSTAAFDGAQGVGPLDDTQILTIFSRLRSKNFHVYLLPQPASLPFGHTREDILIVRP